MLVYVIFGCQQQVTISGNSYIESTKIEGRVNAQNTKGEDDVQNLTRSSSLQSNANIIMGKVHLLQFEQIN